MSRGRFGRLVLARPALARGTQNCGNLTVNRIVNRVLNFTRQRGEHLVDGHEAALEPLPRDAQIDPPDAHPLVPAEPPRLLDIGLEAPLPLEQRARVVRREALDVAGRGGPAPP